MKSMMWKLVSFLKKKLGKHQVTNAPAAPGMKNTSSKPPPHNNQKNKSHGPKHKPWKAPPPSYNAGNRALPPSGKPSTRRTAHGTPQSHSFVPPISNSSDVLSRNNLNKNIPEEKNLSNDTYPDKTPKVKTINHLINEAHGSLNPTPLSPQLEAMDKFPNTDMTTEVTSISSPTTNHTLITKNENTKPTTTTITIPNTNNGQPFQSNAKPYHTQTTNLSSNRSIESGPCSYLMDGITLAGLFTDSECNHWRPASDPNPARPSLPSPCSEGGNRSLSSTIGESTIDVVLTLGPNRHILSAPLFSGAQHFPPIDISNLSFLPNSGLQCYPSGALLHTLEPHKTSSEHPTTNSTNNLGKRPK
ncbi:hypothetical protein P3S67_012429 [Capsicum chacoense]